MNLRLTSIDHGNRTGDSSKIMETFLQMVTTKGLHHWAHMVFQEIKQVPPPDATLNDFLYVQSEPPF